MKTYLVIPHPCPSGLALRRQPEMELPFMWDNYPPEREKEFYENWRKRQDVYDKHIASREIIEIAIEHKEHWKIGDSVSENEFDSKPINYKEFLSIYLSRFDITQQEEIGYADEIPLKDSFWANEHYKINRNDVKKGTHIHTGKEYLFFNDDGFYIGYTHNECFIADSDSTKFNVPKTVAIPKAKEEQEKESYSLEDLENAFDAGQNNADYKWKTSLGQPYPFYPEKKEYFDHITKKNKV